MYQKSLRKAITSTGDHKISQDKTYHTMSKLLWLCKVAIWHAGSIVLWAWLNILSLHRHEVVRIETYPLHATHFQSSTAHFLCCLEKTNIPMACIKQWYSHGFIALEPFMEKGCYTVHLRKARLVLWFKFMVTCVNISLHWLQKIWLRNLSSLLIILCRLCVY